MSGPPPGPQGDGLWELWMRWRSALAPLGIAVPDATLRMWRDLQGHGAFPFTRAGESAPDVVARLLEAARATAEAAGLPPNAAGDHES